MAAVDGLLRLAKLVACVLGLLWAGREAFEIRTYAIRNYGRIIHEFDPWFNFRATQYLFDNGMHKFFRWFDHMSWYPLGRPVGTTIYPGMQLTSVFITHALERVGFPMSLNDVCCFVPCWFGTTASLFVGGLAAECSGNAWAAPFGAAVMAVIPAHIMRSVGGGYDNESIAVTAMTATFFFWCRSLRTEGSWPVAFVAAAAYIYMVAAWGGYVFVLNMVGVHAASLVIMGRFSESIYKAYTIFYVLGTAGAVQVPVVGWTPLRSMEQMGPLVVFLGYQFLFCCELLRRRFKLEKDSREYLKLRMQLVLAAGAVGALVLSVLVPMGYFGPLSARVRGLFIKHMKTGNPLVDSVAEHQPATADAYWHHLHYVCYAAPVGWVMSFFNRTNSKVFILLYGAFSYFFANKMNRLIILMGPIASALAGVALGTAFEWVLVQARMVLDDPVGFVHDLGTNPVKIDLGGEEAKDPAADAKADPKADLKARAKKAAKKPKSAEPGLEQVFNEKFIKMIKGAWGMPVTKALRVAAAAMLLFGVPTYARGFYDFSHMFAEQMSQPSVVFKARLQNGQIITVNDYLDAYHWLRDNTPEDARVLSWWDYGYQITGIGNRTTLADGNTWNLEHIALIGRCLTSPEPRAHRLIRHLADYVLVWTGGGSDDLAKSPHIARIGNSVFNDICPRDPLCRTFGFYDQQRTPTPSMAASLLYKMHSHNQVQGVQVDEKLFTEVFTSRYNKVRIYKVQNISKKSKRWAANPENRLCDAGGWFCPGQYPPGLPTKPPKTHATLDYAKAEAGISE